MGKSILFDRTKNGGIRGNICYDGLTRAFGADCASVLAKIARYSEGKAGVCQASEERLAWEIGISARTLETHIKTLESEGFITDHTPKLRNQPHTYTVNVEKVIEFERNFQETIGDYDQIKDQVVRKIFVAEENGTKKFRTEYAKISYRDGIWYAKFSYEEKILRKELRKDSPAPQGVDSFEKPETQEEPLPESQSPTDDKASLLAFLRKRYDLPNDIGKGLSDALEKAFEGKHKKSIKPISPETLMKLWTWSGTEKYFKSNSYRHNTKDISNSSGRALYDLSVVLGNHQAFLNERAKIEIEKKDIQARLQVRQSIDLGRLEMQVPSKPIINLSEEAHF